MVTFTAEEKDSKESSSSLLSFIQILNVFHFLLLSIALKCEKETRVNLIWLKIPLCTIY